MPNGWPTFTDSDGVLVPMELITFPFTPRRIFYVTGVPKGEERGMHAHYQTQQILTCIQGEILIKLHDGSKLTETVLTPNKWVFVDKFIWDSQIFLTGQDILLSICSTVYNKADYIEDFEAFLTITGNQS
tara:strand:- start:47 stop:436 length:390 start_codon:yes stop_codon:yes gene_type:complete